MPPSSSSSSYTSNASAPENGSTHKRRHRSSGTSCLPAFRRDFSSPKLRSHLISQSPSILHIHPDLLSMKYTLGSEMGLENPVVKSFVFLFSATASYRHYPNSYYLPPLRLSCPSHPTLRKPLYKAHPRPRPEKKLVRQRKIPK